MSALTPEASAAEAGFTLALPFRHGLSRAFSQPRAACLLKRQGEPLAQSAMSATSCLCYAFGKVDGKNKLYFGDNLKILRDYVPDASVDLIYLDPACAGRPPINSSPSAFARGGPSDVTQDAERKSKRERKSNRATYNVLFKEKSGEESAAVGPRRAQGGPRSPALAAT